MPFLIDNATANKMAAASTRPAQPPQTSEKELQTAARALLHDLKVVGSRLENFIQQMEQGDPSL